MKIADFWQHTTFQYRYYQCNDNDDCLCQYCDSKDQCRCAYNHRRGYY